jgi:hypothetical protein
MSEPKAQTQIQCNDRFFMESPISSTSKTASSPGTRKPTLNTSAPMIPPLETLSLPKTISANSLVGFATGEASSPSAPGRLLPTAEEIQASKPPPPRVLTMTSEDFYQWRQVLGNYKKYITTQLNTIKS